MFVHLSTQLAACEAVAAVQCLYPWLAAAALGAGGPAAPEPEPAAEENLRALGARLALWALGGAAAVGAVFHAYFLAWALRWGFPRLALVVLAANAVQAASLLAALAALWATSPGLRLAAPRRWARTILGGRAREMAGALAGEIPEGAVVLDVGAGSGLMLERLQEERGIAPLAFDVHPVPLGSVPVRAYDGVRLPVADRSADVVVCVSALHHCHDPVSVLRELRRVTRGRALILEDGYDGAQDRVGTQLGHVFLWAALGMPWCPGSFGTEPVWRRRLAEAGFRVAEFRRVRVRHARGTPLLGALVSNAYLIAAEPA